MRVGIYLSCCRIRHVIKYVFKVQNVLHYCQGTVSAALIYVYETTAIVVADPDWLKNLSKERIDRTVSERALARIANEMSEILIVGPIMGFTNRKTRQYQDSCPHSVKQQFSLMFNDWRRFAPDKSVGHFVRLMREVEVDDNILRRAVEEEDDNYEAVDE